MAIIKIAAPLSGIRGTIGGITYSANRASPYAKAWAPATNPRSQPQAQARIALAQASQTWPYQSSAHQAEWNAFAADPAQEQTNSLGEAYYLSGFQWYAKCNARLSRLVAPQVTLAPTTGYPDAPQIDAFRVCTAGSDAQIQQFATYDASTWRTGHEAYRAFDGNLSTWWSPTSGTTTGWLTCEFPAPVTPLRYRIYMYLSSASQMPKNWTFQAWNGASFTTLHTIVDHSTTAEGWVDCYIANPMSSDLYRIDITANQGHPTALVVWEVEMYTGLVGASCIAFPYDTFDNGLYSYALGTIAMGNSPVLTSKFTGRRVVVADTTGPQKGLNIQALLEATYGTVLEGRSWFLRLAKVSTEGLTSPWAQASCVTTEAP